MRKRRKSPPFTDTDDEGWVTRPRRPLRTYDFDANEEEEEYQEPEEALLYALRRTESYRRSLENEGVRRQAWLRNNPRLAARWAEFTAVGGVSSDDWEAFLIGRFRAKVTRTRTRKHLRLVSNRRPARIRLRRRDHDGPDEAA